MRASSSAHHAGFHPSARATTWSMLLFNHHVHPHSCLQLQECGQPPSDIIKDLAPGLELNPDGLPMMPNMGPGMGNPAAGGLPGGGCAIM